MGSLRYLSFSANELTGTIPSELGELGTIEFLSVSRNSLSGEIPSELGGLTAPQRLYLYENELTGEVPELAELTRLETLWIHDNGLSFGTNRETLFSLDFTPGEDKFGDKYFFFTIPIEPDWADSLERITLTGPDGIVSVNREDQRVMTVVTEPGTGRIRALLRDWEGALPETLRGDPDLAVVTTRGLGDAVRLRR